MVQVEVKALFIGDNACIRPLMLPEDIRTRSKLWNIGYMHVCGFFCMPAVLLRIISQSTFGRQLLTSVI